jgi:hypothetical protein
MLTEEVKTTLEGIKFRPDVFVLLDQLAAQHDHKIFISQNSFQPTSRLNKPFGIIFHVEHGKLTDAVVLLKETLPSVYTFYEIDRTDQHVHIAIIRPTDKYEILRIMGTNAEDKYDLDTGTLLARMRKWEEEYGLDILGAGNNWIEFSLQRIPGELREFVEEMIAFAPGTLSSEDIKSIEQKLKSNQPVRISW